MRKPTLSNDVHRSLSGQASSRLRIDPSFVSLALGLAAVAALAERTLAIDAPYAAVVLAVFAAGAAVVLRQAARHLAGREFGAANRLTLARAALAALCGGLLLARPGTAVAWFAVAVALLALVLDGFDGSLARRRGLASAFGARFDMEIDALTILIMSALAWRFERAGVWVLASGLARYAFVAAGSVWPWLRRPLPPSRRRQTVCVVQAGALVACLAPVFPPRLAAGAAAIGLAALAASFAVDVFALWRAAHPLARLPRPADPRDSHGPFDPPDGGSASGALAP